MKKANRMLQNVIFLTIFIPFFTVFARPRLAYYIQAKKSNLRRDAKLENMQIAIRMVVGLRNVSYEVRLARPK